MSDADTAPSRPASDADTDAYAYDLPRHLIAKHPLPERDASRLLVLRRDLPSPVSGSDEPERLEEPVLEDRGFKDFLDYLDPGDALVVNDSRVFPARLVGRKPTGAAAEILLLRPIDPEAYRWEALVRPGQKLKPGRLVEVGEGLSVRIEASREGGREVRLETAEDPWAAIERHGLVPLPPYIRRESTEADRERYQTVYAAHRGSVAAPTAGLHLTDKLLEQARRRGVHVAPVTLHVGPGTFRPVEAPRLEGHRLESEQYIVGPEIASTLNDVRASGGRVVAVGTTVVRLLEATVREDGAFEAGRGATDLFIHPPFRFRAVDRLLTNFHLPRSTLLMLVAAFAGRERVLRAYRHAVAERYRFYSYGDAMLVL
jgi:S-adenosylmethionine:tRNA ribosyltransferase-isomerase